MGFLIYAGFVSLVFGILLLFFPQTLRRLSQKVDKVVNRFLVPVDEKVYKIRIIVGILAILASIMIYSVVFFLIRKYG